jgi:hypothetical protein
MATGSRFQWFKAHLRDIILRHVFSPSRWQTITFLMSIRKVVASKHERNIFDFPESFHMNGSKCPEMGHNHFRSSPEGPKVCVDKTINKQTLPLSEPELGCRFQSCHFTNRASFITFTKYDGVSGTSVNGVYALKKSMAFLAPIFRKTHKYPTELSADFLYWLPTKSVNKCGNYGYKFIYIPKSSMAFNGPFSQHLYTLNTFLWTYPVPDFVAIGRNIK